MFFLNPRWAEIHCWHQRKKQLHNWSTIAESWSNIARKVHASACLSPFCLNFSTLRSIRFPATILCFLYRQWFDTQKPVASLKNTGNMTSWPPIRLWSNIYCNNCQEISTASIQEVTSSAKNQTLLEPLWQQLQCHPGFFQQALPAV